MVETLQLQNITLAGHSVGGAISIRYMARHNGYRVSKLALIAAAAPSFTKRPEFPYGMTKEEVTELIEGVYNDRPKVLRDFGEDFFFRNTTEPFSDWFFHLGLQAAGWSTAAVLASLRDESLFSDLGKIRVPTIILHGIHDQICPYLLAEALRAGISNSRLVPFETSGHGLFWEERDKLNNELIHFIG